MVKAAVNFGGGVVVLDVQFWRTNESINREAMEHWGPLTAGVKNSLVERGALF